MTKVQTFPVKGYIDVLLPSKTFVFHFFHVLLVKDLVSNIMVATDYWIPWISWIFFGFFLVLGINEPVKDHFFNFFLPKVLFWSPWKHQKTKGFLIFSRGSEGNIGKKRVKLVLKLLLNSKSFTRSGLNTTRTQEKLDNREKIIFSFPLKKNSGTKSTLTSIKLWKTKICIICFCNLKAISQCWIWIFFLKTAWNVFSDSIKLFFWNYFSNSIQFGLEWILWF